MAVAAAHLALRHLPLDVLDPMAIGHHSADGVELGSWVPVVELQHLRVSLAAIDARVPQ
jgi:hypothetical protein